MSDKADKTWFILRDTLAPYILEYANEKADEFGIVSVIDVKVSKDYWYADFYVSSTMNTENLPKYLAKYAWELRSMIWRELWARKSPTIRFKVAKNVNETWDLLSLINEISSKYGLN
ncbi:MAG: hypothetical protein ACD_3C00106G0001 [uncultured bacterium (gcode 4)]|uniref:Ribosome-binding factor A n=1 Tax=uncultured bacterium (gcode 4) TaxID=1234023 RepID=K2G1F3_9BACT|nr:MAG: hypothetical protein ACD_3C00106G0001 [uncultured bacterium (gcode 4)]